MMLTLSEVLQLKLHCEMVVLSACNTGSRQVTRSEGVTSMGTAPRPCCGYDTAHRLQRQHRFFAISQFDSVSVTASLLGPDFCKNIALGYSTTLTQLLQEAANGTPDPKWDFEPDTIHIHQGTILSVVDQGGEPHTFTEVRKFGGGFIPGLNGGEAPVPECAAGFSSVAVARTRILQGSQIEVTGLSQGEHHFQCCIHPWMRVTVDVK
jgi:plastocyanin